MWKWFEKLSSLPQSAIEMNVNMFIINVDTRKCSMFSINLAEALTVCVCVYVERWTNIYINIDRCLFPSMDVNEKLFNFPKIDDDHSEIQ